MHTTNYLLDLNACTLYLIANYCIHRIPTHTLHHGIHIAIRYIVITVRYSEPGLPLTFSPKHIYTVT